MSTGAPAPPLRKREVKLTTGLLGSSLNHLAGSLKKQWKRYRKELRRCQDKFSEKAIHDSRVETRRLLSTVELLGGFLDAACVRKVQRALKRHLDTFDDLRDTQVQLRIVAGMRRDYLGARPFYDYLLERERRFAKRTRKSIKEVKTSRLAELIAACRAEVEKERRDCAPRQASKLLLRSVNNTFARTKQLRARINPRRTDTIHRTRVAFKKFRYMVETLADYLPSANEELLSAMHHYQTMMGNIQDTEMLLKALDKFVGKKEVEPGPARRFRDELLRRRQWLIRVYMDAAGQLLEFWPPPEAAVRRAN